MVPVSLEPCTSKHLDEIAESFQSIGHVPQKASLLDLRLTWFPAVNDQVRVHVKHLFPKGLLVTVQFETGPTVSERGDKDVGDVNRRRIVILVFVDDLEGVFVDQSYFSDEKVGIL